MKAVDLLLFPIYLIPIYLIARGINTKYYKNTVHEKYFLKGLYIKIGGAIFAGLLYQFVYGGGDTFNFYSMSKVFYDAFYQEGFDVAFELFKLDAAEYGYIGPAQPYLGHFYSWYFKEPSAFLVSKIAGFIGIFCFNSYTIIAMYFAALTYSGLWLLYMTFNRISKLDPKIIAWSILFVPSIIFWGSGLFKDSITIGALGYFTYASISIFILRKITILNFIALIISLFLLYKIKLYIPVCFVPAFFLYLFNAYKSKIKNKFFRYSTTPIILTISILFSFQIVQRLGQVNQKYSIENALNTIEQTQQWHTNISESGRTYSLGAYEKSYIGILSKIPESVGTSLFKPYLWEARSPLLLLAAIENTFLLYFFIKLIASFRFRRIFGLFSEKPILWLCFIFTINLGFIIGFTTYNYGALVRYKIPLLPFYFLGVQIILNELNKDKMEANDEKIILNMGKI